MFISGKDKRHQERPRGRSTNRCISVARNPDILYHVPISQLCLREDRIAHQRWRRVASAANGIRGGCSHGLCISNLRGVGIIRGQDHRAGTVTMACEWRKQNQRRGRAAVPETRASEGGTPIVAVNRDGPCSQGGGRGRHLRCAPPPEPPEDGRRSTGHNLQQAALPPTPAPRALRPGPAPCRAPL